MLLLRSLVLRIPRANRRREVAFGQIPFLLGTIGLTLSMAISGNVELLLTGEYLWAQLIIAITTVVGFVFPWDRFGRNLLLVIPFADMAATILLRGATFDTYADTGLSIVVPLVWIATRFSLGATLVACGGIVVAMLYPFVAGDTWPEGAVGWGDVAAKVTLVVTLTLITRVTAAFLRAQRARVESLTQVLRESLRESEKQKNTTAAVLDAVNAGIVFYGPDGVPLSMNGTAREFAAQSAAPGMDGAHPIPVVFYPDRTTRVPLDDQIEARALADELIAERVYWLGSPGNQRAVVATSSAVNEISGEHAGTVVVSYDVTALVEAIRVRDEFLATTSHELRTPLTSILGYLELIDAKALGIDHELSVVQRNANRLLGMISNLLDAGREPIVTRVPTDLGAIVNAALDGAQPRAAAAGVRLVQLAHAPVHADVDTLAIGRVIDNLLTNAIKFSARGSSVGISLATDAAAAVIRVQDSGIGVSAEDQRHMFDRFFRSRSAQTGAVPGAGLGLSIAKSLVDAHDGTIEVQSELGAGTTMTVRLPIR